MIGWLILLLGIAFLVVAGGTAEAKEKLTIGLVEEVILLPWGIKLPARIDTGAATSSLDARELTVKDHIAEFSLPEQYGGKRLSLPIVTWKYVRSAAGRKQRPVVEMEFCLGPKRVRTRVNLNDRSMVKYPLILGRSVLKQNFVVDCMKANCLPPSCPEAPSP